MNGEDKIITMLEAMHTDITNVKQELQSLKNVTLRMENGHGGKLQALFDAYSVGAERIASPEDITEKQSVEILQLQLAK